MLESLPHLDNRTKDKCVTSMRGCGRLEIDSVCSGNAGITKWFGFQCEDVRWNRWNRWNVNPLTGVDLTQLKCESSLVGQ